jgi:hypothetical protein
MSDDGGQMTEDRGQMSDIWQGTENRKQSEKSR